MDDAATIREETLRAACAMLGYDSTHVRRLANRFQKGATLNDAQKVMIHAVDVLAGELHRMHLDMVKVQEVIRDRHLVATPVEWSKAREIVAEHIFEPTDTATLYTQLEEIPEDEITKLAKLATNEERREHIAMIMTKLKFRPASSSKES